MDPNRKPAVPLISDCERIWNVSQDLLIVADASGKLLSINPAWTATLGWSEGDLLGTTFEWLCHPDDRAKLRRNWPGWRTVEKRRRLTIASVAKMAPTAGCPGER